MEQYILSGLGPDTKRHRHSIKGCVFLVCGAALFCEPACPPGCILALETGARHTHKRVFLDETSAYVFRKSEKQRTGGEGLVIAGI